MQTKGLLIIGCVLLVIVQLCLADVDDDRQRGELERARRRRKEELRAERRLLKEQRQRQRLERDKRHRQHQEQQHLEASRPQYQPPQPLSIRDEQQNLRPLRNERQYQRRLERRNRQQNQANGEGRRAGRRKLTRPNLRSNELDGDYRRRNITTKANYVCPPDFMRLGNSCYLLSKHILSWEEAHHYCRDMKSHLASLENSWEDENIRNYLNRKELARLERWIGGRFNWEAKRWIWGSSGKKMSYQGFSRRAPNEDRTWHCVFMDPVRHYRWAHKSCFEALHFVCEAPLHKEDSPKDGNEI